MHQVVLVTVIITYYFVAIKLFFIESEFATSANAAAHDAWLRAKVERAMASTALRVLHVRQQYP